MRVRAADGASAPALFPGKMGGDGAAGEDRCGALGDRDASSASIGHIQDDGRAVVNQNPGLSAVSNSQAINNRGGVDAAEVDLNHRSDGVAPDRRAFHARSLESDAVAGRPGETLVERPRGDPAGVGPDPGEAGRGPRP